jgi:hypothetical protein
MDANFHEIRRELVRIARACTAYLVPPVSISLQAVDEEIITAKVYIGEWHESVLPPMTAVNFTDTPIPPAVNFERKLRGATEMEIKIALRVLKTDTDPIAREISRRYMEYIRNGKP